MGSSACWGAEKKRWGHTFQPWGQRLVPSLSITSRAGPAETRPVPTLHPPLEGCSPRQTGTGCLSLSPRRIERSWWSALGEKEGRCLEGRKEGEAMEWVQGHPERPPFCPSNLSSPFFLQPHGPGAPHPDCAAGAGTPHPDQRRTGRMQLSPSPE